MIEEDHRVDRVVILADESANWKIAGLRQLDRLVLALDEFAKTIGTAEKIDISVFWKPEIPLSERWLPKDPRIGRVRLIEPSGSPEPDARILATRLFVGRNALSIFLSTTAPVKAEQPIVDPTLGWRQFFEQFERTCRNATAAEEERGWRFLAQPAEIVASEMLFLRHMGKSQDGIVSKFLNRPLVRPITRCLLRFPIKPTTWTLSMFALPLIAFAFLLRGDYAGILVGAAIYQLFSMLDSCDGEIARAKYLESKRGGRVDDFCDMIGGFVFLTGLGFGLSHWHGSAFYAAEGIFCVAIIAANEFLLRISKPETNLDPSPLGRALYPRYRQVIQQSGVLFLGENFVWCLLQLTKRDVMILFFLILALAGLAPWILHLSLAFAAVGLLLAGITRLKRRTHVRGIVSSSLEL